MRSLRVLASVLLLATSAAAADFTIKVLDPQSAAVSGARVALFRQGTRAVAARTTSAEGAAVFPGLPAGEYRVEVLAPGFAPATAAANLSEDNTPTLVTVRLAVAAPPETVVVTATRMPVAAAEAGAEVASLDALALELLQPVATADALRFLPGAVVNTAGRRGGQASLFVRGGDSRYNKVIVDGVPGNDPGGIFDFGVVPMSQVDRMEFVRGPASALYGSDAMTSVVQLWTATGHTPTPELRFGAEGGTFASARGFASLAGARGRFDYNLFGEQESTQGQGVNDAYSNALQGANLGVALSDKATLRLHARHANARSGVQGAWDFNGRKLLPPDVDAYARQNNFAASAELAVAAPGAWQHRLSGYEYHHQTLNQDTLADRGCDPVNFNFLDCYFSAPADINRAGFSYQGEYTPRSWARTVFGYDFEDENGSFDSQYLTLDFTTFSPFTGASHIRGLRRNHALFGQQTLIWRRLTFIAGLRYIHNESFGQRAVPSASVSLMALRGGQLFSGTRLRFSFGEGIKEPRFEETFGVIGTFPTNPNPKLRPEENRSLEAGVQQSIAAGKVFVTATYFHNIFRDQIAWQSDPVTFIGQYFNLSRALAHGAEVGVHSRLAGALAAEASYAYTSTQILATGSSDPLYAVGRPLLRRPRHSGTMRVMYSGARWGGSVAGSLVGRRADSDFLGFGIDHAAGYARVDLGGWYALTRRITAYLKVENALDRHYQEVVGYPALRANFRAGMRFRVGGE
jgi:outer membrane cobalamin receptor